MSTSKKNYSGREKMRIALEVLSENEPVTDISKRHAVARSTIFNWAKRLKEKGYIVFDGDEVQGKEIAALQQSLEQTRARLGELLVENNFLKKTSFHLNGERK